MQFRIPAGDPATPAVCRIRRVPGCVLVVLGLLALPALGQPAGGLSFERAQTLAIERAPMLAARQATADAAVQLRTSADQLPDPRLITALENLPISGPERFSPAQEPMSQLSFGWMQDVPNAAKRAARTRGAQALAERERALWTAERLSVQREVAQAWLARYYVERKIAFFQALEDENRLLRDTVSARVAGGGAMPVDATMARQEALMLADRRDELARQRAQALATLTRWLGDEAKQPLAGGPPGLTVDPATVHGGIAQHADLQVFEPMARMTAAEVAEMEAAKRGDWSWQVMYSKRGSSFGDMVSVQFSFELPLWAEQRQDPQIAAKRKDAERIAAELEDGVRRRREEMDMQLAELEESTRMLERLKASAEPLATERVALTMSAYQAARGDLAAVLNARRERAELGLRAIELEARQFALRARLNYLIAEQR
jgi:cobalt-zinc-cadmium efflux system outer membrane protein